MPSPNATHTTIIRMRLKPHGLDPHTAQQRLQRSLSGMSLQPTNAPPHSILCIRQLRSVFSLSLHPSQQSDWQHKLQAQINACAASAARPALGYVPANANAVLFNDEAEQLACLARDWLHGTLRQQWWWAALLARYGARGADEAVRAAWLQSPAHAPAALAQLAACAQAEPFVHHSPDTFVVNLLQRVITLFGLRHMQALLSHSVFATQTPLQSGILAVDETSQDPSFNPWRTWLPSAALRALSPAAACLLGIGLGLQRAAAQVQTPEFAQCVLDWLETTLATPHLVGAHNPTVASVAITTNPTEQATAHGTSVVDLAHATPLESDDTNAPLTMMPPVMYAQSASTMPAEPTSLVPVATTSAAVVTTPQVNPTTPAPQPNADNVLGIYTQFGGTFYLINVMLHLGWYADFTQPLQPGLDQNIYDLLAQIGERTFGDHFRADALCNLLSQLAGHEPQHEPRGVAHADAEPRGVAHAHVRHAASPDAAHHARMRALQHRLTQALGEAPDSDWLAFVCAHPARIVATATRLTVFLSLEKLPIAIRLSGLDRDPGWVPAAGRFIAFHFD